MASGQSKIELILDLKNRIGVGLSQAKKQINTDTSQMQRRLNEFSASSVKNFKSAAAEIPMLGNGLRLMSNPIAIASTLVTGLAAGFVKATDRAAEFNHEFRDLANLNLDKPQSEINDLRKMVLDSAWRKGFNAEKTANAYNELQSTAGIYGAEARPIVEKQGEFALLMKTSMDSYVAGTAKAMANWRFGVDKLDAFNKSNYAAMQVGVVSFEELAKVQSTFAGSAASINQSFDTANKLFSLFTVKTKSVDEAATLTKSLFNDLTKATTVKAFKKIGIDLFDSNKRLKQADMIMLELNDKFLKLKNDKSIVSLKNQFHGSEGLIAMIQAATDKSGELRKMLDEFKDSKFNTDAALLQAQNDIVARQEKLANRIDLLVIKMGHIMLPIKEWFVDKASKYVEYVGLATKSQAEREQEFRVQQDEDIQKKYGGILSNVGNMSEEQYNKYLGAMRFEANRYFDKYSQKTEYIKNANRLTLPSQMLFLGEKDRLESYDKYDNFARQKDLARSKSLTKLMSDFEDARLNKDNIPTAPTKPPASDTSGDLSGISDKLNRVVGASQAPRNITVNIDAFNKGGINTQNTSLQNMDAKQIEDWFIDMCYRAIRNVELGYN
ncbi:phage tail tape measure protein [Dysgonomonas termitidis]|uniref:Phage tail tape measure protein n=1 Tax=Dysgonomonas termitidis TaxID=1516126 RepID=A0ABV9KZJ3_9BACT